MKSTRAFVLVFTWFVGLTLWGAELEFPTRGDVQHAVTSPSKMDVTKVIPHLSANNEWKSVVTIRNDSTQAINVVLRYYSQSGSQITPVFFDSDGNTGQFPTFNVQLAGYEVYSLEYDRLSGNEANFHVVMTSTQQESSYSVEAIYNRYSGSSKISSVGVGIQEARTNFIMGLDQRVDAYSSGRKFRGMALTNIFDTDCECQVFLYDDGANGANVDPGPFSLGSLRIPARSKWLGLSYDLVDNLNNLLQRGIGYVEFRCSNPVAALGLAFEENSPMVASVPIDYFDPTKTKRQPVKAGR